MGGASFLLAGRSAQVVGARGRSARSAPRRHSRTLPLASLRHPRRTADPFRVWHATTEAEAGAGVEDEEVGYEESPEEVRERQAVGALVRWCVERGAAGSGLSVLLPDGSGRGRGLEASRDLEEGEPVLRLPLEMGICDYQDGHPEDAWETMSNAPWGVRLACRLLQERAKGDDSEWAPYLALIPDAVPGSPLLYSEDEVLALQYPPAVAEAKEMREAVSTWHAKLMEECPSALAGADLDGFKAAVSVVHSRTYGIASAEGQGYFRALLPLADLLNHGGDQYPEQASLVSALAEEAALAEAAAGGFKDQDEAADDAKDAKMPTAEPKWPAALCTDNIAWSELDDDGVIEFAATRAVRPNEEALMSYGERSNDHFLMYYGFVPPRNPHDDVIVFSDVDHALSWHMVYHPELWDEETSATREAAARAAVREVEKALEDTSDGALAKAEPRFKVLAGGRADARLVSLYAAAYAGTDEGTDAKGPVMQVDIDSAHADVARRCAELLRGMPTTATADHAAVEAADGSMTPGAASALAYRAHKKEVLLDAVVNLGGGRVKLPEA